MVNRDQLKSMKSKAKSFESNTGIPIFFVRKEYGAYQVCVDNEKQLNDEQIEKAF